MSNFITLKIKMLTIKYLKYQVADSIKYLISLLHSLQRFLLEWSMQYMGNKAMKNLYFKQFEKKQNYPSFLSFFSTSYLSLAQTLRENKLRRRKLQCSSKSSPSSQSSFIPKTERKF